MAKACNQKAKILYLMKLFLEETDEEHPLSRKELEEHLGDYGIHAERKSLYNDIETLKTFGLDILYRKQQPEGYYIASRTFEIAELKLLVDAIQSSRFITEKKSSALIQKVERLSSKYEAKQLQRQVVVARRIKAMNESIFYNVDKLHLAIGSNQQILFQYFEWTVKKEIQLKKKGTPYQVSPWALTWDAENYYLIGYDMEAGKLKHFRVDKMLDIVLLEEPRGGKNEFERFDLARYTKKMFGMFGGEEQTVRIRFKNRLIGVVLDRFGKEAEIRPDGEEHFILRTEISVSEPFFGWVTGLGRDVEILSPQDVVEEYQSLLQDLAGIYEKNNKGQKE